jgi:dipeptidyl aminopeptidase/acylaminoacyl peptidase
MVRDRWEWDPEVQMLASRGYAVPQPQFRGSSGFGARFQLAGYHEWGRAMQDDITAGARWLADQGIADARRICIYGASYGGYAALWGVVKTPELYRCGVSFAGVSDLSLMFKDDSDVNDDSFGRLFRRRTVGDPAADEKLFDEVSPLKGAAKIQVPMFIAHGNLDARVPIVHSEKMVQALKANGKQVEWMPLPGERHGLGRDAARQRLQRALQLPRRAHLATGRASGDHDSRQGSAALTGLQKRRSPPQRASFGNRCDPASACGGDARRSRSAPGRPASTPRCSARELRRPAG